MRPTIAEIDLQAINLNLKNIRKKIGRAPRIMAVVKANAYGHGMIPVVASIVKKNSAQYFGVAIVEEGIDLRKNFPSVPVHVLTSPEENQLEEFLRYDLELTLCDKTIAVKLNSLAKRSGCTANVHIKVDTGMGRIGIAADDALEFVRFVTTLSNIHIKGIWTHFATSDEKNSLFARQQLSVFRSIVTRLELEGIHIPLVHCANSGAIVQFPESYFDMVRPGIMLYGYHPSKVVQKYIDLHPALSLKGKVGFVKRVSKGTSISYGRRYVSKRETTIASLTLGYADGYFRTLTNKAKVLIHGKEFLVAGTVCMDQIMIDTGSMNVKVGDEVVLIGESHKKRITAWDLAEIAGTIPYEITCSISQRVPRKYING